MTPNAESGDVIVIGPECFASADEDVICWKGRNYYAISRHRTPSPNPSYGAES